MVSLLIVFLVLFTAALAVTAFLHLIVLKVPYVPTSRATVDRMLRLAELQGDETVMDLGAGDGRLLIAACKKYPGVRAVGIEYVPTVWLLGWLRIKVSGLSSRIAWKLGDARKADVSRADTVFLYVSPNLMAVLEDKFDRELHPGTVVIANSFSFPGRDPQQESREGPATVRRYRWKRQRE